MWHTRVITTLALRKKNQEEDRDSSHNNNHCDNYDDYNKSNTVVEETTLAIPGLHSFVLQTNVAILIFN